MIKVKTSAEREAELQAQLDAIENKAAAEAADNIPDENLTPEEKTFKKRYSDLRSHSSRRENDLLSRITNLEAQLSAATKKEMNFPKTADEVQAWAAKYPEIYDTIVTIARQNAIDVAKDTEEKVLQIQVREHEAAKRAAYADLIRAHEDFEDLATSEDFIEWVETQPKYVYDALYVNETDALAAIRVVDLYKSDRGILKDKKKEEKVTDTRDAARRIPPSSGTSVNNGHEPKWTESKVQKVNWNRLTPEQVQEIEEAMLNPAFYDVSGGAR